MGPFESAVVLEFVADDHIDLGEIERLAEAMPRTKVVAVAQALSASSRETLAFRFSGLPNVEFADLGVPIGRGAAIRAGLSRVREEVVAIVSLDERVDAATVLALMRRLRSHAHLDAVFAARSHSPTQRGFVRSALSGGYNLFANALFGLGMRDVQAPIKVFRLGSLSRVLDGLQLRSHAFDVDLIFQARRHGLVMAQVTIGNRPRRRRWPVVDTALRAISSLLVLRLLYTPLGAHPLVMRLGRPYVVARKDRYSVLIFCWRDPKSPKAGGGEVYLYEQARHWVRQGHEVTWVAQGFKGGAANERLEGIRVVRVGRGLLVFPAAILWYVFRSGWRFDFIVDVMNGIPFFTPIFSGKPKACLVYHVHAAHFRDELPRPISDAAVAVETKLVPWIYRRTRFLTISESSASEISELGISRLPIEIVHSGVDSALVPGRRHEKPTILFLGRLRRYKGVRKLIDAFVLVKTTIPDARLVIAGTGDDEIALRDYARDCSGIEFTGRVDDAKRRELYQEAWVLGMPSQIEGWGIVVIEAASCGTPSVAYDVNGLRDCINDAETGYLVKTDVDFAKRIELLLRDDALRRSFAAACLRWSQNFSWDRCAERTIEQVRRAQLWSVALEPRIAISDRAHDSAASVNGR